MLPPEPRRERNAAATQKRLLDAAEREFAARGFAGARLREIAEGAGVQPALIHHYFADKQGLYRAVLDRALLVQSTESMTILGRRSDIEGLVTEFVDMLVGFYAAHHDLMAILRNESTAGGVVFADVCKERVRPILDAVTATIEERQRAGEVRADVSAGEILVAALGMIVHPFAEPAMVDAMLPGAVPRGEAALARHKQALAR